MLAAAVAALLAAGTGCDIDLFDSPSKKVAEAEAPQAIEITLANEDTSYFARKPGGGKLKPIEDAPGSYVRVRY